MEKHLAMETTSKFCSRRRIPNGRSRRGGSGVNREEKSDFMLIGGQAKINSFYSISRECITRLIVKEGLQRKLKKIMHQSLASHEEWATIHFTTYIFLYTVLKVLAFDGMMMRHICTWKNLVKEQ